MKILYTADDRRDAQLAASAFRRLAPDITVVWAARLADARAWVADHHDLAAIVVDAQVQNQSCASFVRHVRSLGLAAPVLVVAPEHTALPLAALEAGADECVLRNQALVDNLTAIVGRSLQRAHAESRPLRLLYVGDAALARACVESDHCAIEITEALRDANGPVQSIPWDAASGTPVPFDVILVEHDHPGVDAFAILRDAVARELPVPVILAVEWNEQVVIPALKLGATEHVVKAKDALRALLFRLDRRHREHAQGLQHDARLQTQLTAAEAALHDAERRRAAETDAAAARARRHEREMTEAAEIRQKLEGRLEVAVKWLQDRDAVVEAASERLTKRETELAEATATRHTLERDLTAARQSLTQAESTLRDAEDRRAASMMTAAAQRREDQARHDAARRALEQDLAASRQKLTESDSALCAAERRHASDMTAATAQLATQQSEYETQLAQAAERLSLLDRARVEALANEQRLEERLAAAHSDLRAARDAAEAARLAADQRHAEFESALAREAAARRALEQDLTATRANLAHAETARREADVRHEAARVEALASQQRLEERLSAAHTDLRMAHEGAEAERLAAEQQAAERHTAFKAAVAHEVSARTAVAQELAASHQKLAETESALGEAGQRHASEIATAAAQLAERQHEYETLERWLADAQTARRVAQEHAEADRVAAAQQASQRYGEFESALARESDARRAVEQDLAASSQRLTEKESALSTLEQRHASAMTTAAAQLAEQQSRYETLEGRLADAHTDLRVTHERAEAEQLAAKEEATQRHSEYEATVAREVDARHAVEQDLVAALQQFAEKESALANAEQRHAAAMTAAAAQLAERQGQCDTLEGRLAEAAQRHTEYEAAVAQEIDARRAVEQDLVRARQQFAEKASALAEAEQRHAAAMTTAAAQLAERQSQYETLEHRLADTQTDLRVAHERAEAEQIAAKQGAAQRHTEYEAAVAREIDARRAVEQDLVASRQMFAEKESVLAEAEQRHAAAMTNAAAQLAERQSQYETLGHRLADTQTDLRVAHERAEAEQLAAKQEAAKRQTEFVAAVAREVTARRALEQDLATSRQQLTESEAARRDAEQGHASEMTAAAAHFAERVTQATHALHRAEQLAASERAASAQQAAERQTEFEARLSHEVETRHTVEQTLAATRDELLHYTTQLAQATTAHAALEQRLTSAERQHASALESAAAALAEQRGQYETRLAQATAAREVVDQELREAEATIVRIRQESAASAVAAAAQLTQRQSELARERAGHDATRAETRRQFEQSPVGILRLSHKGALQEANQTLIDTLGYRTVEELRAVDFAAAVFESADDLPWLIEHCQQAAQSIDSVWKKQDGGRLHLRLHAGRISGDAIEIVADDLTSLRTAEERLRQAARMEAVGRLAAEVAGTCDNLLRNVCQDGQQWLAAIGGDTALRQQGELILGDVTRAATILRQLSVYGDKQARSLSPVDVNRVLRNLEPVLKRVAGDDIELVLPKKVPALNVDVDAERVERVLVNVAAYGRTRMPLGGRLIVELARVAVGRDFVTKHPNVREGGHALIRITEVRAPARAHWPLGIHETLPAAASAPSERPGGVELGAIQALIGDCGGDLWMNAEPGGEMEVKIRLPLRAPEAKAAGARAARGGAMARWFHS